MDAVVELTCDQVREMAGAFVLGALDPATDAAVRAHLASCADPHQEVSELGSVLPALAESVPVVEPPDALKARIMAAAAEDLRVREVGAPVAGGVAAVPSPVAPTAPPTSIDRAGRRAHAPTGGWLLRIAAVLAIVALGGWNLLLQGQLNAARTYEQNVATVFDKAAQPGSLTAILVADGGRGSGVAAINADGRITIAMRDLAPTEANSVYEAWIIASDGVPAPLGSFKVGNDGIALFATKALPPPPGTILALTLEAGPNAQQPTLPIISKGVATGAG